MRRLASNQGVVVLDTSAFGNLEPRKIRAWPGRVLSLIALFCCWSCTHDIDLSRLDTGSPDGDSDGDSDGDGDTDGDGDADGDTDSACPTGCQRGATPTEKRYNFERIKGLRCLAALYS